MKSWIDVPDQPAAEHRDAVVAVLTDFNARSGVPVDTKPVAVLLKDDQGRTIGGLWGKTSFGWLYVEFLVVPDSLRGHSYGSMLMDEAEGIARDRGCAGSWLTTFTFQARGFYEKLGYELFGELDKSPGENISCFCGGA